VADIAGNSNDRIDGEFTAYPLRELAGAALDEAARLGAQHADFRAERVRGERIRVSDGALETLYDADDLGLAVRVVVDGTWGFAAASDLTSAAAARAAAEAVEVAKVAAAINSERIELAEEPAHGDVTWLSSYQVDPFEIGLADKVALLESWSSGLLAHSRIAHVDASLQQVRECKFYSDGATTTLQQRVRILPQVTAVAVEPDGRFETMRTLAPPAGRGLEYLGGSPWAGQEAWDFPGELANLPTLLAEKLTAPSVEAGRYDLVIEPSNLWLTIHESIGHATELDRALGYEAAYAGTSFATPDTSSTGGSRGCGASAGPTAVRSRTPPPTCRSSGWPTSRSSRPPAAPPSRSSSPGWRTASTSPATRAGRSTCSATTSSSPGSASTVLTTAGSAASSATSPTRPPPPTSGTAWRRSAGRRPTSSGGRSTAARGSQARWRR
jgi:hypothetical protein